MVKKAGGALLPTLNIDRASEKPLGRQLSAALRELILSGGLGAGERLPATRTIASDLSVSRTVVVEAFERLAAEGLIVSKTGAGTFISQALANHAPPRRSPAPKRAPAPRLARVIARGSQSFLERPAHVPRAFTTALPAFDAFPMALWSRHVAKHWRRQRDVVLGYGETHGFYPLRRAIAAHLRANRGILCEPEEIFVVNGAQHGFQLIAGMLLDPGSRVWFENPGAIGARNCFAAAGAKLVPGAGRPRGADRRGGAEAGAKIPARFRDAVASAAARQHDEPCPPPGAARRHRSGGRLDRGGRLRRRVLLSRPPAADAQKHRCDRARHLCRHVLEDALSGLAARLRAGAAGARGGVRALPRRLFPRRAAQPAGGRRRVHRRGPFRLAHPPHAKTLCGAPRGALRGGRIAGSPG